MAHIYVRQTVKAGPTYSVRWTTPEGAETSLPFKIRAEAERFKKLLEYSGGDFSRATEIGARIAATGEHSLDEAARLHLHEDRSGTNEAGRERNRIDYELKIAPLLGGGTSVTAISREDCVRWLREVRTDVGGVPADATAKRWHSLLSGILGTALDEGWISKNPARGIKLPRRTAHLTVDPVFLSWADYGVLLSEVAPSEQPLVEVLARTGLRWGEATGLLVGDVDLRASIPVVRVRRSMALDRRGKLTEGPPKTDRARRDVSLGEAVIDVLRPLVARRRATERLFLPYTPRLAARGHQNFYGTYWRPAVAQATSPALNGDAALVRPPRIHDLRHTHVSWLIEEGIDLPTISARLGHESIETTVDRYGHISPTQLRKAAAASDGPGSLLPGGEGRRLRAV